MNQINSQIDVSIIIVNWNTCDITRDCLQSIQEQDCRVNYETIVIDNHSSDESVDMIKQEFPDVILIENDDNRGFAAANNQGMEIARGRYVLLLNSDTLVLDNAIEKTLHYAESHTEAAIIGCRVLNHDHTMQATCFMYPSITNMLLGSSYLYKLFPKSRFFGRERMTWWQRDDEREVEVVTGCFMFVRKDAIDQVGMMDDSFFMYGEETDWCYRFKQAGWKILFTPTAEIIHLGGSSSRQVKPKMIMQLRSGILKFMHKHNSRLSYILACLLVFSFFFMRVPYWLLRSLVTMNKNYFSVTWSYLSGALKSLRGWKALAIK